MAESIYGKHKEVLPAVLKHLVSQIENYNETKRKETGELLTSTSSTASNQKTACGRNARERAFRPCRSLRSMISMTQSASASSAAF